MSDGIKFDDNKIKMELLPFDSLLEVGKVLTHGAKKYAPHNWKLIKDSERYIGALLRHLIAMECGERIDPDSGLTHISHIACNALFLVHFDLEKRKTFSMDKLCDEFKELGIDLKKDKLPGLIELMKKYKDFFEDTERVKRAEELSKTLEKLGKDIENTSDFKFTIKDIPSQVSSENTDKTIIKRTPKSFGLIWKIDGDYARALFGSDSYNIYITPGHCTCFKNDIEIGSSSGLEVAYEVCQRDVDKFISELGLVFEEDSNSKYVNGLKYTNELNETGSTIEFSDGTVIGPSIDANYLLCQISNFIKDRLN